MSKPNKFKILLSMFMVMMVLFVTACSSKTETATETATPTPKAEIVKINFYGKIVEYTSGVPMTDKLKEVLKDKYDIEAVQVDWGNLDKVIKTGIASGTPSDIYQYWPMLMKQYVDNNQALDLTPYLEANGGEWKNTFNQTLLEMGKYNGKYYNVPLNSNFATIYINPDIFAKAGVAIPTQWTWDEFIAAGNTIKTKTGVFPFVICKDIQNWVFRNGLLSVGKTNNSLDKLAAAEVPATDPMFATVISKTQELYKSKLAYPGDGAITISRDEAKAAFYQGKVAMIAEVSSFAKEIFTNASTFKPEVVLWPAMGKETVTLGGADGLFVPVNAPNPDASVEVLKTYLGSDIQKIHADMGYATANVNVNISDPIIASVAKQADFIYPFEFSAFNAKLTDYIWNKLTAEVVLNGKSVKDIQNTIETLRKEALSSK